MSHDDGFFDSDSVYADGNAFAQRSGVSELETRPDSAPEDYGFGKPQGDLPMMPLDLDMYAAQDDLNNGLDTGKLSLDLDGGDEVATGVELGNYKDFQLSEADVRPNSGYIPSELDQVSQPQLNGHVHPASTRQRNRPQDQLKLGGELSTRREDNINQQHHAQIHRRSKKKPKDTLKLEGDMELIRTSDAEHGVSASIHRESARRPQDHFKLEGDLNLQRPDDINQQNFEYKRVHKASARQRDNLKIEGELDLQTDSKEKYTAHTERAGRMNHSGLRTRSSLHFDGVEPGHRAVSSKSDFDHHSALHRPTKHRAKDNMRVGEGRQEMQSSNKADFKHGHFNTEDIRAKPPWFKEQSVTIGGAKARDQKTH